MKVAILGAGVAGLHLARRLMNEGIDVQVFEKARGPSGRLSTRRTDAGQFDHGAQYFTARDPVFRDQVAAWTASGIVSRWDGEVAHLSSGNILPKPTSVERFVGVPKMSAIARDLAGDADIQVGTRIEEVRREEGQWVVQSDAGFEFGGFDALMIAVPAPQALPFLRSAPLLEAEVRPIRMLPCHAAMVTFASDVSADFDAAFVDSSTAAPALSWVARNQSKPGRGEERCWVLHSEADWSGQFVDLDGAGVGGTLLADFAHALGAALPPVEFITTHRWLFARPAEPLSVGSLWEPSHRIGVCGDWLRGDRVEDAYLSAEHLADRFLSSRQNE